MYAVPESFLEIEVRSPMTHGEKILPLEEEWLMNDRGGTKDVH